MANEKNLINGKDTQYRSGEEAARNGREGGIKSGESRRKKKLLKDCMLDLLELPVANTKQWNRLSKMGIDIEDIDNRTLLTVSLFMKAVETGDVSAFREIRNLIGEDGNKNDSGDLDKLIEGLKEL